PGPRAVTSAASTGTTASAYPAMRSLLGPRLSSCLGCAPCAWPTGTSVLPPCAGCSPAVSSAAPSLGRGGCSASPPLTVMGDNLLLAGVEDALRREARGDLTRP